MEMKRICKKAILCNTVARLERSRDEFQAVKKPGARLHLWPITLCLLMAVILATSAVTQAAVYYVDPAGGNDSAGGSASNPWRTINKAKSTVNAGDIVNLMPGNYGTATFTSNDRHGTSNNYITYRNNPGSTPYSARFSRIFFDGIYRDNVGNTNFYIAIEGFDVENTSDDACIKVQYGSYVDIIDCKAHGRQGGSGPSYGNIFTRAAKHILIEGCEIYYSGGESGDAIQLESCDSIVVSKCHIHDTMSSGIQTGGGQNYVLEYNVIHDQRADWNPSVHGSGIAIHSHNTVIRGNIIYNYGNTRPIRFYQDWAGAEGYRNMLVENNLVYKTSDFTGTQWWTEFIDVGPNCIFRNNTFIDDVTITFASNADGSGLAIYNNIVTGRFQLEEHGNWQRVSEGGNIFGRLGASGCGWVCFYNEFSPTSNSIVEEGFAGKNFFNSTSAHYPYSGEYPYQLSAQSVAIDFGVDNMAPETDLRQNSRIGPADAGCFEYGQTTGNRPPVADAGVNQTVVDIDNSGSEMVALDAAASTDADGQIVRYIWTLDNAEIAAGVDPVVELRPGQHTISLTVTDNEGMTDTDTVTVTVVVKQTDDSAPSVLSVASTVNSVTVVFNEAVEPLSAEDINNYQIDNDISIISAGVDSAGDRVVLRTSSHIAPAYTLTCGNISDLSGNVMASTTTPYYNSALKAFWKFNEQSGSVVADSSEYGNIGALVNGPQWTEYGVLMFDGVDDYVNCGTDSSMNLTGSLTISACVNPAGFGQNGWGRIVDKGNGSTGFSMFIEESSRSLSYVIYGGWVLRSDPDVISLDKWQHVAVVYDDEKHTVDFYVDGQPAGSSTYATPAPDSSSSRLNIGIRGYDLNRAFDGMISTVRLYNSPLMADDTYDLFPVFYAAR
ncbi:MAG: right-handed parallel beta-helix repeat-containing protein [Planctomycetes bacterium]|nr:right-handed parallel beta-helix repeat-containing protein [Planctomycetota bacterium]